MSSSQSGQSGQSVPGAFLNDAQRQNIADLNSIIDIALKIAGGVVFITKFSAAMNAVIDWAKRGGHDAGAAETTQQIAQDPQGNWALRVVADTLRKFGLRNLGNRIHKAAERPDEITQDPGPRSDQDPRPEIAAHASGASASGSSDAGSREPRRRRRGDEEQGYRR